MSQQDWENSIKLARKLLLAEKEKDYQIGKRVVNQ